MGHGFSWGEEETVELLGYWYRFFCLKGFYSFFFLGFMGSLGAKIARFLGVFFSRGGGCEEKNGELPIFLGLC